MNEAYLKRKEVYKKALNAWGIRSQLTAAIEELSELIVEIAKKINGKRKPETWEEKMVDELADSLIMIEQISSMFNLEEKVDHIILEKINRLDSKLGSK